MWRSLFFVSLGFILTAGKSWWVENGGQARAWVIYLPDENLFDEKLCKVRFLFESTQTSKQDHVVLTIIATRLAFESCLIDRHIE